MSDADGDDRESQTRKRRINARIQPLRDTVSTVKHAADNQQPLSTGEERVGRAIAHTIAGQQFTDDERARLRRIRSHLVENLFTDHEDFEDLPMFARDGGWPHH
jgi:hypothetical protein